MPSTETPEVSSASPAPEAADHEYDPELASFLTRVTELSALRHGSGPEAFLARIDDLATELRELRKYRTDRALGPRLEAFAARRFELVDDSSEYALATDEVIVLSLVLADAPDLAIPALKRGVIILSAVLTEDGVPRLFGQLLKRLRDLSRQTGDLELKAWLTGVADALPGD
jgi:hypothetical protein